MSREALTPGWKAFVFAALLVACRERRPQTPVVDWKPAPGVRAESAGLLVVDAGGATSVVCLPGEMKSHRLGGGVALAKILDVTWRDGPIVAGWALGSATGDATAAHELVLASAHGDPRRITQGVRTARFSPDGASLAYDVDQPAPDGTLAGPIASYVLDVASGDVRALGPLVDPLWESDGKHVRATLLRTVADEGQIPPLPWISLRARWDRDSGTTTLDGRGSAQIPAPSGAAVAWTESQRSAAGRSPCSVFLGRWGGVRHLTVGSFCKGIADDRSVRWSADGRWLAFPHPGPLLGPGKVEGSFVDVVSPAGGRYPALSELHGRMQPGQLAIATTPGSLWFDWSPSGRFLALQDGAREVRIYAFEAHGMAFLGKGQQPMWSPGGTYLLMLSEKPGAAPAAATVDAGKGLDASVLLGVSPMSRLSLGPARDARWLPLGAACAD